MPLFMQIDVVESGLVTGGDGVLKGHEQWISFDSFSFGSDAAQSKAKAKPAPKPGEAPDPDSPEPAPEPESFYGTSVTVNRKLDVVSPQLMKWLSGGKQAKVEIHHCTMTGIVLFSLTLGEARLKDYSAADQDTDGEIAETLTITWQKFDIETIETGVDGKPLP